MNKRRDILQLGMLTGAGLLATPLFPRPARGQSAALAVSALNDKLLLIKGACNILARQADNGELLVVDGGLAEQAEPLLDALEARFGTRRIATLTNSHWHPENVGLNLAVGNRDTRIFAHENTRQWLGTDVKRLWQDHTVPALPEHALPSETFHHYGSFQHGSSVIEYGYLRQAHTDGDMYIFLPEDNVLHAGGVIASDGWPFMDWWTGGWIGGVVDAIETLLSISNNSTVIVPGSGPVMTRAELEQMRDMYADIFAKVRGMFVQANTVEQTVAAKPAGPYEAQYGNADSFIELAHWSLIAHLTPDA